MNSKSSLIELSSWKWSLIKRPPDIMNSVLCDFLDPYRREEKSLTWFPIRLWSKDNMFKYCPSVFLINSEWWPTSAIRPWRSTVWDEAKVLNSAFRVCKLFPRFILCEPSLMKSTESQRSRNWTPWVTRTTVFFFAISSLQIYSSKICSATYSAESDQISSFWHQILYKYSQIWAQFSQIWSPCISSFQIS